MQQMTDAQAVLLLEALYQWVNRRVCRDAYEDEFVDHFMRDLCNCASNLQTALEVSDDFAPSLEEEARDYFNGNIERARAA